MIHKLNPLLLDTICGDGERAKCPKYSIQFNSRFQLSACHVSPDQWNEVYNCSAQLIKVNRVSWIYRQEYKWLIVILNTNNINLIIDKIVLQFHGYF